MYYSARKIKVLLFKSYYIFFKIRTELHVVRFELKLQNISLKIIVLFEHKW